MIVRKIRHYCQQDQAWQHLLIDDVIRRTNWKDPELPIVIVAIVPARHYCQKDQAWQHLLIDDVIRKTNWKDPEPPIVNVIIFSLHDIMSGRSDTIVSKIMRGSTF